MDAYIARNPTTQHQQSVQQSRPAAVNDPDDQNAITEEEEMALIEQIVNDTSYMAPRELLDRLDAESFRRWQVYNERANAIDDQVVQAKDRLYKEKLMQLKHELVELDSGRHAGLCTKLKALERERDHQHSQIKTIAQTRIKYVESQYELELAAAQEELKTSKRHLRNAWKAYIEEQNEEPVHKKRRKDTSARPVFDLLQAKVGMMNAVTNRRQAVDRLKLKRGKNKLANSLDGHDEDELDKDILVMHKIIDTHESYQQRARRGPPGHS